MAELLEGRGFQTEACRGAAEACERVTQGAGTLLLTDEALELSEVPKLFEALKAQPAWSELPLIVLTSRSEPRLAKMLDLLAEAAGSITLLERPVGTGTLLRSVQVALHARRRQYQVRDLLAEQQRTSGTLQSVLDTAPTGVVVVNASGEFVLANAVAHKLVGGAVNGTAYGPREGYQLCRLDETPVPPDELPLPTVLREAKPVGPVEILIKHRDGNKVVVLCSATPLLDGSGKVSGATAVMQDITERKATELVRARLAAIVESSNDAIIGKDLNGVITSWNAGAEQLFGYTARESVGQPVTMLIPPEKFDEEPAILERIRRGESVNHYETVRRRKDGVLLDVSVTVSPVLDRAGRIVGASKIARDVTGRKQAEAALRESEERFRNLAENIPQLAWMADELGWATWYNQRWYDYTGATWESMRGSGWKSVHHPDHVARVERQLQECLERGVEWEDTFPIRSKTGEYRWFLSRAFPIRDTNGRITRWFGTNTDITEHKNFETELERQVAERTAELRATNEQLEAFVYSIAHDLRAPLRSMMGYSQLLLDDHAAALEEPAQQMLKRIQSSSGFMDKLLLDLLAFGRAARAEVELGPVEVHKAWQAALFQCATEIDQRQAQVEAVGPLPRVRAHEATLAQCLANLLSNSLKFVAPGVRPSIRFRAEDRGSWVRLWVEDNGIGIPARFHEKVFRVFERLQGARYPGTGIGLSIVRKGAERMGGGVGLESEAGKGSRFWIELEAADPRRDPV
jgi:PAS domain S-box-containing protein